MLIEFTRLIGKDYTERQVWKDYTERQVWVEPKNVAYVMKGFLNPEVTVIQFTGAEDNYIIVKESLERVVNDLYAAELS